MKVASFEGVCVRTVVKGVKLQQYLLLLLLMVLLLVHVLIIIYTFWMAYT